MRPRKPKKEIKQVLFEDSKFSVKDKSNPHINFSREARKGNSRKDPTEVKCTKCGVLFVLPFKPRRPDVLCNNCFKSESKSKSDFKSESKSVFK